MFTENSRVDENVDYFFGVYLAIAILIVGYIIEMLKGPVQWGKKVAIFC